MIYLNINIRNNPEDSKYQAGAFCSCWTTLNAAYTQIWIAVSLFAGCNYEKEVESEAGTLHNITDLEHQYF